MLAWSFLSRLTQSSLYLARVNYTIALLSFHSTLPTFSFFHPLPSRHYLTFFISSYQTLFSLIISPTFLVVACWSRAPHVTAPGSTSTSSLYLVSFPPPTGSALATILRGLDCLHLQLRPSPHLEPALFPIQAQVPGLKFIQLKDILLVQEIPAAIFLQESRASASEWPLL